MQILATAAGILAVIALTRYAPSFDFLGARLSLFGWLAYVIAITAAIPALAARLSGIRPVRWGLSWGRSRRDAPWIALAVLGAIGLGWALSRGAAVRAYYPRYAFVKTEPLLWIPSTLAFGIYGYLWELMFRGRALAFVMADRPHPPNTHAPANHRGPATAPHDTASPIDPTGPATAHHDTASPRRALGLLALQTGLFALAHVDKPPLEAWLSIPAGVFFGLLALRTRSVWPGFLLHFAAATSVNLFCAYA